MSTREDAFEAPSSRRTPRVLLVLAVLLAAGLVGFLARPGGSPSGELPVEGTDPPAEPDDGPTPTPEPPDDDGVTADLDDAPGSWSGFSGAPLAPRQARAVWSGHEVLVWGGQGQTTLAQPFWEDGAAYDPESGRWRRLAPAPIDPRSGHAAVWADDVMLVWGGQDRTRHLDDGAAYDPESDSWSIIPPAPLSPRRNPVGAWVGGEMVVAGGRDAAGPLTDAAAYDPREQRWRPVAGRLPLGLDPHLPEVTVADDRLVVWTPGLSDLGEPPGISRYDPRADRWEAVASPPLSARLGGRQWLAAAGEGGDLLVAGLSPGTETAPRLAVYEDGWDDVGPPPGSPPRAATPSHPASSGMVGAGDAVFVVDDLDQPLRYDLAERRWTALPPVGVEALESTQMPPLGYQAMALDDGFAVWLGGATEPGTGGARMAGVVVWRDD